MTFDKQHITIDFGNIGGPIYVGRSRGEMARQKYQLNNLDSSDVTVKVIIPPDTYSINSSFFLGMFGDSVKSAGSREAFLAKYSFQCSPLIMESIERDISRALQEKKSLV